MHYWLTVVWLFILWTSKGLTESKPRDSIEYRSIETDSWKPLPLTSGRIIPPAQPSIDQHNSRYNNLTQQLANNFHSKHKNSTINRLIFNYIKFKENNPLNSLTDKKNLDILQELYNLNTSTSNSYRKISSTNKIRKKRPSWHSNIQKVSTKPKPRKPTYNYTNPTPFVATKPLPITINKNTHLQHSTYQIDTANPYEIIPVTSSNPSPSSTPSKCPTVYITALTTLNESNTIYSREGCSDLKIVINSQIHNHNIIKNDENRNPSTSSRPTLTQDNSLPLNIQNDQTPYQTPNTSPTNTDTNGGTNINIRPPQRPNRPNQQTTEDDDPSLFTTIVESFNPPSSWVDTLNPILGVLLTPLSVIAAGGLSLLIFLFPYSIPSLLTARSSRKYPHRDQLTYEEYVKNVKPSDGWYWHDGYQTWANSPPQIDEYDRTRRRFLTQRNDYRFLSPYRYYGDRGKYRQT